MNKDQKSLVEGRRQQRYDREGSTSFQQENFGAGGDYRGELEFGGFGDQDFGSQGYSGQGYGDRSYGDPDYGGQAYARRTSDVDETALRDPGATDYERSADHGMRDVDGGTRASAAVEYGDVGDARGRGQTYGGHNYDGRGRRDGVSGTAAPGAGQRGVGPRGYVRSDARVLEDVCEQLQDDDLLDAGDIEVQVAGGVVTLTGSVGSREARWHAENVASDARGVVDVVNELAVRRLGVDDATREA